MKALVTDYEGVEHSVDFPPEWPLMEAIKAAGLPIKAECGGCCLCATCHVYVAADWVDRLPPIDGEESSQLGEAPDVLPQSRLACQLKGHAALDGVRVTLAPVY